MTATIEWFGCATFRLTIDGLVVFLDAYMDRVSTAPDAGLRAREVARADYVLVGHSHFDHLAGAEVLAHGPGARVIGSNETANVLQRRGEVPGDRLIRVQGGERIRLSRDVIVRVFPSLHSCTWTHGSWDTSKVLTGDVGLTEDERAAVRAGQPFGIGEPPENPDAAAMAEMQQHMREALGSAQTGGALAFLFETPAGTIFYHDTSGCWTGVVRDLRPDVAIVAMAGRGNIDGEPLQGSLAGFVGQMGELLQPGRMFLGHHDNWMPPLTRDMATPEAIEPVREELRRTSPGTRLVEVGFADPAPVFG